MPTFVHLPVGITKSSASSENTFSNCFVERISTFGSFSSMLTETVFIPIIFVIVAFFGSVKKPRAMCVPPTVPASPKVGSEAIHPELGFHDSSHAWLFHFCPSFGLYVIPVTTLVGIPLALRIEADKTANSSHTPFLPSKTSVAG